ERSTSLPHSSASKTLFYLLTVSSSVLLGLAVVTRQTTFSNVTPLAVASLAYPGVIFALASYLAWYWLLTRYSAARLSV
ncbi:EamA/RhaT family transporter, partial [Burkholderia pseudomallei]